MPGTDAAAADAASAPAAPSADAADADAADADAAAAVRWTMNPRSEADAFCKGTRFLVAWNPGRYRRYRSRATR